METARSMPIRSMKELIEAATAQGRKKTAVTWPHDQTTLQAVKEGLEAGLLSPCLYGDVKILEPLLKQTEIPQSEIEICQCDNAAEAAKKSVESIKSGKNVLLMKGKLSTPALLKVVLDKEKGIGKGRLCSYIAICQIPGFERLILSTDGGLNISPTLAEKTDIVKNAVDAARALGISHPKVAVLAAVEDVNPKMQACVDAACLSKMGDRGLFGNACVDGPLAFDNIISAESAKKKGIKSEVAGQADIILSPTIEVANAMGKTMTYLAGSINAGVVVGAAVPVILPSRAGNKEAKLAALAAGCILGRSVYLEE